ncbi:MAG: DUF975 family protein, partial [Clostridium sp.]|nr:DUF975 family protein [Clostridium sp.]
PSPYQQQGYNQNRYQPSNGYNQQGYNQGTQYQTQYQTEIKPAPNGMATASLVMGILSLVCCWCGYVGIAFGSLGIIFALLSKRDEPMSGQAKTGLTLSIIGLALYVMIDCPDLGAMACLRASVKLTKRRRWQLFCFHLSFIGWHILGQLSYGIGMLWIMPYIQCATFGVYQDLKAEKEQLGIRWRPDPAAQNHTAAS